VKCDFLKI